jgi:DNA polymerase-1
MNKLLILDGNSVLHRAFYAMPDWRNRSGEATSGVYGFLSMMLKAIEELKPTHVVVVFDHHSPTFRHTMYVGYQTNREKDRQISEDIWGQIDKLKIVLEKMGVPVCQVPGFEADDVIGSLATQCADQVVIITGDRDLMQLVNDRVNLYMPL